MPRQKTQSPSFPTLITHSPDETVHCGRLLARFLRSGDVLLLKGDLGSGKTTLVKGVVAGLGGDPNEVHSPSFVLMNLYETKPMVVHCDFYRLSDPQEIVAAGCEDLFARQTVTIVEWPQRLAQYWTEQALVLELKTHRKETTRRLCIRFCPESMRSRIKRWLDHIKSRDVAKERHHHGSSSRSS